MSSRSPSTIVDAGVESRRGGVGPLNTEAPAAGSASMPSGPTAGAASVERGDAEREIPPAASRALAHAVADGAQALNESMVLCSVLLTVAVGALAWSVPSPGASAALALLCLALISLEQAQARGRFRRAVARAGAEHGLTAPETERGARALLDPR
ncbi:hypothetical protein WME99_47500 [Sorangium sp. So ce136]|uniref:hypothetical protein n=1 Tax=Sorangium sp. So ce136 TaxID=3133284 RepID=UPI003F0DDCB0